MSEWVALGGLLVAGLSLFIGYLDRLHSRSEALRTAVYERQLDAIAAISLELASMQRAVGHWLAAEASDQDRVTRRTAVVEALISTLAASFAHRAVLPAGTYDEIGKLLTESSALLEDERQLGRWYAQLAHVFNVARRDMGVDRLSDRIRQLTGATKDDKIDDMVQELLGKARAERQAASERGRNHS